MKWQVIDQANSAVLLSMENNIPVRLPSTWSTCSYFISQAGLTSAFPLHPEVPGIQDWSHLLWLYHEQVLFPAREPYSSDGHLQQQIPQDNDMQHNLFLFISSTFTILYCLTSPIALLFVSNVTGKKEGHDLWFNYSHLINQTVRSVKQAIILRNRLPCCTFYTVTLIQRKGGLLSPRGVTPRHHFAGKSLQDCVEETSSGSKHPIGLCFQSILTLSIKMLGKHAEVIDPQVH